MADDRTRTAARRGLTRLFAGAALAILCGGQALAQAIDCGRLQLQIASLPQTDSSGVARYLAAAQQQRAELERTADYARQLGCERRQFLFFGSAPPPQCGPIGAQMQRMQANLAQISAQIQRLGGGADVARRELTARYAAYCRSSSRDLFNRFYESPEVEDDAPAPRREPLDYTARGGPKAVCVRTCDGAFFPVSYAATQRSLGGLAQLCSALCPNAETEVFTYSMSRDIDDAVSMNGVPYRSMPYAGKFRTKVDSSCSCRGEGQSWVDALADAEKVLGSTKKDTIVTPEKSEELSKPKAAKAVKGATEDDPSAVEAAIAAKAPTASEASSGINAGVLNPAKTFGRHDGEQRQIPGKDGVTKRVRVIGPTL